ncbi:glucan biosynthesis protein, partial [Acinetobacter baumannii]
LSGAYQFVLHPGTETGLDVRARIFMRNNVSKLGIAPLTSMYFSGENQHTVNDDYRPEVHDSDGLLIASGTGEWLWRPLVNPKRLLVT